MKKTHVSIGLTNPQSPSNVGVVMRAAGCYEVDSVFYTGRRYAKAAKFHTDTHNSSSKIPLTGVDSLLDALDGTALEDEGIASEIKSEITSEIKIVCVELVEGATPLPEFVHPDKALYIFGPEDGTIEQKVVDKAHAVVYVPTVGCMNLAATVNVLLYDRLAKSATTIASDELIRKSRDINNHVKVKQLES